MGTTPKKKRGYGRNTRENKRKQMEAAPKRCHGKTERGKGKHGRTQETPKIAFGSLHEGFPTAWPALMLHGH